MRLFKVIIAMVSLLVCSTIVYAGDYSLALNYGRAMPLETSFGKTLEHGPAYGGAFTYYQRNVGFTAEFSRDYFNSALSSFEGVDYGFDVYQGGVQLQAPGFWFFTPNLKVLAGYSRPWFTWPGKDRSYEDFHFSWTVGGSARFRLVDGLNGFTELNLRNVYYGGPKQFIVGKVGLEYVL